MTQNIEIRKKFLAYLESFITDSPMNRTTWSNAEYDKLIADIKNEKLPEVPLKLALVEIKINEVRDVMFYGSKITQKPKITLSYDGKIAQKIEEQVYEKLKSFMGKVG